MLKHKIHYLSSHMPSIFQPTCAMFIPRGSMVVGMFQLVVNQKRWGNTREILIFYNQQWWYGLSICTTIHLLHLPIWIISPVPHQFAFYKICRLRLAMMHFCHIPRYVPRKVLYSEENLWAEGHVALYNIQTEFSPRNLDQNEWRISSL